MRRKNRERETNKRERESDRRGDKERKGVNMGERVGNEGGGSKRETREKCQKEKGRDKKKIEERGRDKRERGGERRAEI